MARYPLNGNPPIRSKHGEATNMGTFGKHLGIDRSVVNVPFYAPGNGKINIVTSSSNLGKYIEAEFFGYTWRFAHLSRIDVKAGQNVSEGQQLGVTGNTGVTTGAHLHYDARKKGTAWNASFNNYVDPDGLIAQNIKPKFHMPQVDSKIQLIPKDVRTTFKAGTSTKAGEIKVTDNTFVYIVRGVRENRIVINSASAGGNGVELALYYTDGKLIPGWKRA